MTGYIIVQRDDYMRDCGVFTGQMQLAPSKINLMMDCPLVLGQPEWSPYIEHAYVFTDAFQAHRWLSRLLPPWNDARNRATCHRPQVRHDGEFFPGEHSTKHRQIPVSRINHAEMFIAAEAFEAGVREGERRMAELNRGAA